MDFVVTLFQTGTAPHFTNETLFQELSQLGLPQPGPDSDGCGPVTVAGCIGGAVGCGVVCADTLGIACAGCVAAALPSCCACMQATTGYPSSCD